MTNVLDGRLLAEKVLNGWIEHQVQQWRLCAWTGHKNILVITGPFSWYAQAIPTWNQTAKTTARVLFDNFIVHYGLPARNHSDQGQKFESHLIKELCQIAKSKTTPYHPMGNGQVEWFKQSLLKMLGTLEEYQKSDWKSQVSTHVHAYNATFHNSTGFSPYIIMFQRHPRLAIDAFLGITPDTLSLTKSTEYVCKLRQRLNFEYRKAQEQAKKTGAVYKHHYGETTRSSVWCPEIWCLSKRLVLKASTW